MIADWKTGFPDKDGEYLVTTEKGNVEIEYFTTCETADYPYPAWDFGDVVAWDYKPKAYKQ